MKRLACTTTGHAGISELAALAHAMAELAVDDPTIVSPLVYVDPAGGLRQGYWPVQVLLQSVCSRISGNQFRVARVADELCFALMDGAQRSFNKACPMVVGKKKLGLLQPIVTRVETDGGNAVEWRVNTTMCLRPVVGNVSHRTAQDGEYLVVGLAPTPTSTLPDGSFATRQQQPPDLVVCGAQGRQANPPASPTTLGAHDTRKCEVTPIVVPEPLFNIVASSASREQQASGAQTEQVNGAFSASHLLFKSQISLVTLDARGTLDTGDARNC